MEIMGIVALKVFGMAGITFAAVVVGVFKSPSSDPVVNRRRKELKRWQDNVARERRQMWRGRH